MGACDVYVSGFRIKERWTNRGSCEEKTSWVLSVVYIFDCTFLVL